MAENTPKTGLVTKILFLVGILFLVFLFAFALIKFVPKIFSGLASIGQVVKSPLAIENNNLTISADKTFINSGENFTLSWAYNKENGGYYAISYQCQDNLEIKIKDNNQIKVLLCNTPYNLNNNKTANLTANLKKQNTFTDAQIKIEYINKDTKNILASNTTKISIQNEATNASATEIITEPVISTSEQNNNVVRQNNVVTTYSGQGTGAPDLAISNTVSLNDSAAIFIISNIGGQPSGPWYFEYVTPDRERKTSPVQPSLAPGQGIRFTLRLSDSSSGDLLVVADPQNNIREKDENNNVAHININGNGSISNNNDDGSYNRNDDADLKITNLETGRLSGNRFIEESTIDDGDEAAIRFTVKNQGGKSTGSWKFKVNNLPYDNNNDDYISNRQNSLSPGQSKEIIVGFDNAEKGRYSIKVKVDSENDVREEDERNNDESVSLRVN